MQRFEGCWPPFRWFNIHLDLMPLAVALHVGRIVADAVLMPEFERDAGRGVFQLRARSREKSFAAGGLRYLLKDRLPLHVQRPACPAAYFDNPDAVNLHAGFLEQLAQFAVGVARGVVLTVRDQEYRVAAVTALLDLLDPQIRRVINRRLPLRIDQRELIGQRVAVGELGQQVGALIERDQEKVVVTVGGLDEGLQRLLGAVDLAFHAPRNVEHDTQVDRRVVIAEEGDLLLDLVFVDLEVLSVQSGHQPVISVGHRDRQRDQIGFFYEWRTLVSLIARVRSRRLQRRLFLWSRRSRSRFRFLFLLLFMLLRPAARRLRARRLRFSGQENRPSRRRNVARRLRARRLRVRLFVSGFIRLRALLRGLLDANCDEAEKYCEQKDDWRTRDSVFTHRILPSNLQKNIPAQEGS